MPPSREKMAPVATLGSMKKMKPQVWQTRRDGSRALRVRDARDPAQRGQNR
jgi:hypothetical protein